MKLYLASVSPVSLTVQLALAVKQLDHEVVDLTAGDQAAPRAAHDVPALACGEILITQPLAIVEYLEESRQDSPLYPENPLQKALVRSFVHIIVRDLIHWQHNLSSRYIEQGLGLNEESQRDWLMLCLKEGFSRLEHLLAHQARTGTYCFGETFTLADLFLVPQVLFARKVGLNMAAYPHIERIYDNCLELDWCRTSLAEY